MSSLDSFPSLFGPLQNLTYLGVYRFIPHQAINHTSFGIYIQGPNCHCHHHYVITDFIITSNLFTWTHIHLASTRCMSFTVCNAFPIYIFSVHFFHMTTISAYVENSCLYWLIWNTQILKGILKIRAHSLH